MIDGKQSEFDEIQEILGIIINILSIVAHNFIDVGLQFFWRCLQTFFIGVRTPVESYI